MPDDELELRRPTSRRYKRATRYIIACAVAGLLLLLVGWLWTLVL